MEKKQKAFSNQKVAYVTAASKSGSTIRIDQDRAKIGQFAMYVHCQTTLVESFKRLYPDTFRYEGNRAILFHEADKIPIKPLHHCISLALTYHLHQKAMSRRR